MKVQSPEPKESRSVNSGTSLHIIFNKELLRGLIELDRAIEIQAGGKLTHLSQIGSLHKVLQHLPLPVSAYHYSKNAIANLLSFAKLADEYYIICNTRVEDVPCPVLVYRIDESTKEFESLLSESCFRRSFASAIFMYCLASSLVRNLRFLFFELLSGFSKSQQTPG